MPTDDHDDGDDDDDDDAGTTTWKGHGATDSEAGV